MSFDRRPTPPAARWRALVPAALAVLALAGGAAPAGATPAPTPAPASAPDEPPAAEAPPAPGAWMWGVEPVTPSTDGSSGTGGRSRFVYDAAPGEVIADHVGVFNLSSTPLTFTVYATDAFTAPDGSFALLDEGTPAQDIGTWVELAATEQTVEPGTRADIPFTLRVPANASPGDHTGAIVAATVEADGLERGDGVDVQIQRRVGTRIYVRVDGPVRPALAVEPLAVDYDLAAGGLGGGDVTVTYEVRNVGNVRLSPEADVAVTGPFGWSLGGADPARVEELLPGSATVLTEVVEGVAAAGRLTVRLEARGTDAEGTVVTATPAARTVTAVPWALLAVAAAFPAAVVAWRRHRRGGRRTARHDRSATGDEAVVDLRDSVRRSDGDGPAADTDPGVAPAPTPADAERGA